MAEDIKYQINGLPADNIVNIIGSCLLYTSPSPRD